ncbi:hypothetical protein Q8791_19300 [Nocardiopsis sp. CT-R113]|uniref:DUF4132 domain-containing protein n=1 Tax=Nocardiopsis codii TaxID=3065942 RepID=A0ABU7KAV7_9ACTN|nr:hypothetical protein [Nocardiopsis sp. CT-R113]MEE2039368.1 hypothetical protein [Nocardiopsis sp. CT-R113]
MDWIPVTGGYAVRLRGTGGDTRLVCRNPRGRELARVPASLKDDPDVAALRGLRAWLGEHEEGAHGTVLVWVLRSLPVPAPLIAALWPDAAWRRALGGLVVAPAADPAGVWKRDELGLLTDADPDRGLRLTGTDGAHRWTGAPAVVAPHPALIGDAVPDWRGAAAPLGLDLWSPQFDHPVWPRADDVPPDTAAIELESRFDYELGSTFERRVNRLGGRIRGETAHFLLYGARHGDGPVPASLSLRWQGPDTMVDVRSLAWDAPPGGIDEVAWSESVRILVDLYDHRSGAGEDGLLAPDPRVRAARHQHLWTRDAAAREPAEPRRALLAADGVAPLPAGPGEDVLVALRLAHPALDGPVVTLEPRHSASAQLEALALFGLRGDGETETGARRHRPPGFLAVALSRAPELRETAVGLLPALARQGEVARTKPGRAHRALTAIGDALSDEHPVLAAPFYDECSQVVLEAGSPTYAIRLFDQARDAERTSADVDEDAVVAAYRRFPALDALPRSLRTHAESLAARLEPSEAYRRQRDLVTTWCEGDRRASADLAAGLASLADDAGIVPGGDGSDDPEADARALRALLVSGSLELAPKRAWDRFGPLLAAMARHDPRDAGVLATRLPAPSGTSARAAASAIGVLVRALRGAGLTAPFSGDTALTGAQVKDWLERFLTLYTAARPPVDGLAELLADAGARLRSEGLTCDVSGMLAYDYRNPQPLDLLDTAVSSGVPASGPGDREPAVVLHHRAGAERRDRDLSGLAADPRWRVVLTDAAWAGDDLNEFGRPGWVPVPEDADHHARQAGVRAAQETRALAAVPGVSDVLRASLDQHAENVAGEGLAGLHRAACAVARFTAGEPPAWWGERAAAIAAAADPEASLALTLRSGIADELALASAEEGDLPARIDLVEHGTGLFLVDHDSASTIARIGREERGPWVRTPFSSYSSASRCPVCLASVADGTVTNRRYTCGHTRDDRRTGAAEERIRFPGTRADLTVSRTGDGHLTVSDEEGRALAVHRVGKSGSSGYVNSGPFCHRYAAGTRLVPPPGWWGSMRPRDAEGSAALRTVDSEHAARLLAAVDRGLGRRIVLATDRMAPRGRLDERTACVEELTALVRPLLPGVTHARLLMGVTSLVWTAVESRERLADAVALV